MTSQLPLVGIRVVDMADEKGELCGRLLAELGADVVKVEPPEGAVSRRLPPLHDAASLYFAVRNTNKLSVTLDLGSPDDRVKLSELLGRADVWVESSRPGQLDAVGLDPRSVAERFSRLVVTSITDFGHTGPYRAFVATDAVMVAMSGLLFRSGMPEQPPLLPPGALAYDVAGVTAAFAALSALWQRLHTGTGQHIDLSVMQAASQIGDWSLPNYAVITQGGGVYSEVRNGAGPVYPLYPCADGNVRLVVLSPRQWRALRAWLGDPEILQDDHWDSLLARMSIQHDILDPLYAELFADKTMVELATEAQRRGIVMTPVLHPSGVLRAEHFAARGSFVEMDVAEGLRGPVVSGFFEIDGERVGPRVPAPSLGAHNHLLDTLWADSGDQPRASATVGGDAKSEPEPPFRGLRVVDFGHGGVGVEAGRMFADYGADVIKIESRAYPDFIRLVSGSEMSPSFASSSRSKRSMGINVKTPEGLEVVKRLIATCDVVIENNSTGTMDDLGLGWEDLRQVNPRLVMLSSQLMGSHGPWKGWLGYGPSTRPVGGMTWLWNFPDRQEPPGASVIHPDHLVGRLCALAGVAALIGRQSSGSGLHVEAAQVEAVLSMLADLFLAEGLEPGSVRPQGNRSRRGAPWGVYPCAGNQRWCVITCRHDADWAALREALGDPNWARAAVLDTVEGRLDGQDLIDQHLGEWTSLRSDREVMERLQAAGVPAGMMMYSSDQVSDPHLVARGYPRHITQPGLGPIVLEGPAFQASAMADTVLTPAPVLAEHTRVICQEVLGMDDSDVDKLLALGALEETRPPSE